MLEVLPQLTPFVQLNQTWELSNKVLYDPEPQEESKLVKAESSTFIQ